MRVSALEPTPAVPHELDHGPSVGVVKDHVAVIAGCPPLRLRVGQADTALVHRCALLRKGLTGQETERGRGEHLRRRAARWQKPMIGDTVPPIFCEWLGSPWGASRQTSSCGAAATPASLDRAEPQKNIRGSQRERVAIAV
jgi:hypothetical protein